MKIELTTKQAAILKTLLKQDIKQLRAVLEHDFQDPEENHPDIDIILQDIADNEELLRLLENDNH